MELDHAIVVCLGRDQELENVANVGGQRHTIEEYVCIEHLTLMHKCCRNPVVIFINELEHGDEAIGLKRGSGKDNKK